MKRLALMVSGAYPCVRVGKMTVALSNVGWEHDSLSFNAPAQLIDVYRRVTYNPMMTSEEFAQKCAEHPGELVHVHNEPNWPVAAIKEYTDKPVILNIHDLHSAREETYIDPYEEEALRYADAHIWISDQQRDFAIACGLPVDKPYAVLPNFATSSMMLDKPILSKLGGIVYGGGLQPRDTPGAWRDLSPIADVCEARDMGFHVYPGNPGIDYGVVHDMVLEYRLYIHHLSRHDWGFSGVPHYNVQWAQSVPNKVFEYFAAGIPLIACNNPLLRPLCDAGLGIYVDKISDIPKAAKCNPKPYRKRVMELRGQFTMERNIDHIAELYEAVVK